MSDSAQDIAGKIKNLEEARDQLSSGWLQTEREKVRILASINYLGFGYIMTDDYLKIIYKNASVESILGPSEQGEWTVNELHQKLGGAFDLMGNCQQVMKTRQNFSAHSLPFSGKNLAISLSPILILKESITCFGVTIIIEASGENSSKLYILADQLTAIFGPRIEDKIRSLKTAIKNLSSGELKGEDASILLDKTQNDIEFLQNDIGDIVSGSEQTVASLVKKESFQIGPVIQECVSEFQPFASSKSLRVDFINLETGFLNVYGDRTIFKQILYKYLTNAIENTSVGTIKVSIEDQKGFLKVSVSDTGSGIADENVKLLFTKYPMLNGKYGTGLYHCKLLAELIGGKAYLESTELGRGSTFAFTIPVATGITVPADLAQA